MARYRAKFTQRLSAPGRRNGAYIAARPPTGRRPCAPAPRSPSRRNAALRPRARPGAEIHLKASQRPVRCSLMRFLGRMARGTGRRDPRSTGPTNGTLRLARRWLWMDRPNNIGSTNPGNKAQSDRADARAATLAPILTKLRASGITSAGALAAALTARNIPTLSGRGSWSAARVRHLVMRIKRLEDAASSSRPRVL